jgi:hypothetical protein
MSHQRSCRTPLCVAIAACVLFAGQALGQSDRVVVDETTLTPVEINEPAIRAADGRGPGNWTFGTDGAIYACDSDQDQLFTLDRESGSATFVGNTLLNGLATPAGLTWNGKELLTIDLAGGELFSLDLETGEPTLIGNTGVSGWQGLASDPTDNGQLYAINQDDNLYRVAREGTLTLIAGGVGFPGLITALTFDAEGTLWGADFSTGQYGTIDKVTGQTNPRGTTITNLQGWDFDENGRMWAENTTTDSLYTIDLESGEARLVGPNSLVFGKGLAVVIQGGGCDPCDANCDGSIDAFDIEPFINVLLGNPGCSSCTGDVNGDGVVDAFDIEPFIACLVGP